MVLFCTPARAEALEACLKPGRSITLSSRHLGLPLGLRALVLRKDALPKGTPFQTGGGTTKIVSRRSVIWEDAPDRFEAGTPAVINAIAFARAIEITRRSGRKAFRTPPPTTATASEILHQDDLLEFSGRDLLRRLRPCVIGRGRVVPTAAGFNSFINLDNAASTPTFGPVWKAVCQAWRLPEDQQSILVARVRDACAGFFGAPADRYDVIFTSNTTEAINFVAKSLTAEPASDLEPVVLNTFLEHNSNELPWRFAKGVGLIRIPVDGEGFPDLKGLERLLREHNQDRARGIKRIRVVTVSGASNVLGTCPDLREISRIAHRYQALVFVDAAQLAGHRKINMEADGIDGLAFSGHKMYAPFGTGGLIMRKGSWRSGGEETRKLMASGEENVAGIAALGKAINLLQRVGMDVVREEEQRLTRMALRELASIPGLKVYGIADPDSPHMESRGGVISFGLKYVPHNLAAEKLAEIGGIGVRNGCFCSHLLVKQLLHIHPVRETLANLGLTCAPRITKSLLPGLVRVSFGLENTEGDIARLAETLKEIAAERSSVVDRFLAWTHNATPSIPQTNVTRRIEAHAEHAAARVYGTLEKDVQRVRDRKSTSSGAISPASLIFPAQRCCCRKH
jgi:selenocysteine lyase/cysteine desulfurase